MKIVHEPFQLETVVESVSSIVYPQASDKGLVFTVPLADLTDTSLVGDSLRLNQILLNLLSNALKFTPEGGSIRMEIRQIKKNSDTVCLRFTVSDTGIGMADEFISNLFHPFEQEDASTSQKYGGTGLGMSITKNLVTLMGGTISVKSKPGKGTTFTVELEFDKPADQRSVIPKKQHMIESLKVLIADDDRDSCIHTSLLLKNMGIISDWVLSGNDCVRKVQDAHNREKDYDVCLIDWKLPDINGIEVTKRVRNIAGPDTTIIIITAYDWMSIEESALNAGADSFLAKPVFASSLYNSLLSVTGIGKTVRTPGEMTQHPELAECRVLLAEDNELNREIAVELLRMAGITADCAKNGEEAVKKFLENGEAYDLILMDVQMPVMDGYQATEIIRNSGQKHGKTIPIIAMTANGRIVFSRCIYIVMAQNFRNQINIICLLVKSSSISTPQLMRSNFFQRSYLSGIFLHQILNCLNSDSFSLHGIKEGILMSFPRDDFAPGTFYVLEQGIGYLITEIDRHFFPAFPDQVKTIIFKIHVIHIKAHQFRHTDPCA